MNQLCKIRWTEECLSGKRKSDTFMGSGYGFRNSGFYCRSLEETL